MSEMSSYSTNGLLSEREHLVMLAILRLGERASPVAIREEIEARTGIQLRRGGIYEALERLDRAGYLRASAGAATEERGGRPSRVFAVTAAGARVMHETDRVVALMRRASHGIRGER